jgi:hypothetical protein
MPKSAFDDALKDIRAALTDEALTPEGRVRAMLDQIEQVTIPPEREQDFRSELKGLAAFVRGERLKIATQSVLCREAGESFRRMRDLARPIPPVRVADEIRRCFDRLQELGWASPTIDLLHSELNDGERIVGIDADSIATDRKRIDRKALIEKHRPHGMTPEHYPDWERQHRRSEALHTPASKD